ncbi:MAG: hypothetical protein IJ072_04305, partial [Oscillospiraceae bacterium]|nr:hypothetical protein [Oscillospiraceae bacterium]
TWYTAGARSGQYAVSHSERIADHQRKQVVPLGKGDSQGAPPLEAVFASFLPPQKGSRRTGETCAGSAFTLKCNNKKQKTPAAQEKSAPRRQYA